MAFSSPYYFVPMAKEVHFPEWQTISHDRPEPDGLSGIIEYEIENHTPILIGEERIEDAQGAIVNFFKTPDEQYAIPGTSIKGMIRNWIEIVTHSRLSIINDIQLSYRDLSLGDYRDQLTKTEGKNRYKPKTKAGWLKFNDELGQWQLFPTEHWRVENNQIEQCFNIRVNDKESPKIYKKLDGIKTLGFDGDEAQYHDHSDGKQLFYAKADKIYRNPSQGQKKGYLVVTGQVSNKKHMNFIFSDPKSEPIELPEEVLKGFHDINNEKEDYKYLKERNHPHGIPVFYLENNGKATQIGLAQMFRFPYKYTVGQLRYDSHFDPNEKRLDFAELLFGKVEDDSINDESRKGRVSFSLARITTQATPLNLPPTVLGAPKSSFYPAYIDQSRLTKQNQYNTYNQNQQKLSGFKRYATHKTEVTDLPEPPEKSDGTTNYDVAVQLRPLPEHQIFKGKVRFHNLKPEELGAILFALKPTDLETPTFHQLGMGKPFGFGKVTFQNLDLTLSHLSEIPSDNEQVEQSKYMDIFLQYINKIIKSNITLERLLYLQSERSSFTRKLTYPKFPDDFKTIKNPKNQVHDNSVAPDSAGFLKQFLEHRKQQQIEQEEAKKPALIKELEPLYQAFKDQGSAPQVAAAQPLREFLMDAMENKLDDLSQEELKYLEAVADAYKPSKKQEKTYKALKRKLKEKLS